MKTLAIASQQSSPAPTVSFEFFPPKTDKMEAKLWESVARLSPMAPKFVSVTYGAGGSTRDRTQKTVAKIAQDTPLAPAAHLTCVGSTKQEVLDVGLERHRAAKCRGVGATAGHQPEPCRDAGSHHEHAGSEQRIRPRRASAGREPTRRCDHGKHHGVGSHRGRQAQCQSRHRPPPRRSQCQRHRTNPDNHHHPNTTKPRNKNSNGPPPSRTRRKSIPMSMMRPFPTCNICITPW